MRNTILTALFIGLGLSASAQTVEKSVKVNSTAKLVYNVDAGSNKKTGIYAIQNLKNDGVWMQGNYKNDERVGTWYFFDAKNKLAMRYNYDQKKLGYIDTTTLTDVNVKVLSGDQEAVKQASAPLPLCSIDYYLTLISNKIYASDGPTDAEITAHVNEDGKATYTVSYLKDNKKSAGKKLVLTDDKAALEWIPSMYNNKPLESEFTIRTTIDNSNVYSGMRRARWSN